MQLTQRSALTLTAVLLVVLAPAMTSSAYADGGGWIDCKKNPSAPGCDVGVGTPGLPQRPGTGSGGGSSGDPDSCTYTRFGLQGPPPEGAPQPGAYYEVLCTETRPDGSTAVSSRLVWIADGVAPDPAVVARQAVSRLNLPLPAIRTSPPATVDVLVSIPVWIWLDAASWGPRSATAAVPGLSITATATPVRIVVATGDGATVTCAGPGTPWTPGTDPAPSSPTCGHVYVRPSAGRPGGVFTMTATVTWNISWAGGGASGTVPPVTTTASVAVRVVESQTVITG